MKFYKVIDGEVDGTFDIIETNNIEVSVSGIESETEAQLAADALNEIVRGGHALRTVNEALKRAGLR